MQTHGPRQRSATIIYLYNKYMKILYMDTETTGTNPMMHEIIQIAAIVEIDGKAVEEIEYKVRPTKWDSIDSTALRVTGKTIEDLKAHEEPIKVYTKFTTMLEKYVNKYDKQDKFYPAGHNVSFDLDFMQQFFKSCFNIYGMGSYHNWRALDTRILANFMIAHGKLNVSDVKLGTLCGHYGISLDAHDALNDIRATRLLYKAMSDQLFTSKEVST